jgi:hypothetical protein
MAVPVYNILQVATGTITGAGATTKVTIQIADSTHLVSVLRLKLRRSAGTAATFVPRLFSSSTGANEDITQEFKGTSAAVADLFDVASDGVLCNTDTDGRIYLQPSPDAGADNDFSYRVVYQVLA